MRDRSKQWYFPRANSCILMILAAMYGGGASAQEPLDSESRELISISGWIAEYVPDYSNSEVNLRHVTVYAGSASRPVDLLQVELASGNDAAHLTVFSQDGIGRTITVSPENVRLSRARDVSDLFVDGVSDEWLSWGDDEGSSDYQAEGDPCKLFPELPACEDSRKTDG